MSTPSSRLPGPAFLRRCALRLQAALRPSPAPPVSPPPPADPAPHRFLELVNGLEAIVWERDVASGRFTFVSRQAEAMLGYPVDRWTGEPGFWISILHPEDRDRVAALHHDAARDGCERRCEYRVVGRDGWPVWVRDSIRPVRGADGATVMLRGVAVSVMENKRTEAALRESEARYRGLFEGVPVGLYRTSPEGKFLAANDALVQMLGFPDREALYAADEGSLYADPDDRWRLRSVMLHVRGARNFELLHRRRDGTPIWVRNTARAVRDAVGAVVYYEGVLEDVTERKQAEEAERAAEAKFRGLVEQSLVGIYIVQAGRVVYANPKFCEIFGYPEPQVLALGSACELADAAHRVGFADFIQRSGSGGARDPYIFGGRRADGTALEVEAQGAPTEYRGRPAVIGTLLDVTRRRAVEEELVHTALHDALTGLPNRLCFMERMTHAMERGQRDPGSHFAVLFLDLNRFKWVNDSLGHPIGDELLVAVARRMQRSIRPGDTVARFGGDEFAVLLEGTGDVAEATRIADRIQADISAPVNLSGYETFTSASIGIALSSPQYDRPEYILRNADMAMYRAKASGIARCEVFDRALHAEALDRLQIETDLRRALESGELRVHYQPIVELATDRICGFEALVRWQHPERGNIAPGDFIPLAEETGLILPLGRWVLGEACRQLRGWQDLFPSDPPLCMGVNLSVLQFKQPELVEDVRAALRDAGVDARSLKLEVTESMLLENAESAALLLERMRSLGIQLYLDDFGTGYSSLSHLHRLPLDTLKVDRSFVSRIGQGDRDAHLVRAIVNLARELGIAVVAEGVETLEQLAALRELGCEYAQGFLFSRPVDPAAAEALLRAGNTGGEAWRRLAPEPARHLRLLRNSA